MYHLIGTGKNYLTPDQFPDQFRFQIALLRSHGLYPTTVRLMWLLRIGQSMLYGTCCPISSLAARGPFGQIMPGILERIA